MTENAALLTDLVRQLKSELEWTKRVGLVVETQPVLPKPVQAVVQQPAPIVAAPAVAPVAASRPSLGIIRQELGDCTRCKLHSGRNRIVFGVGDPNADLMFIGEGPGADEDRTGEPFVGKAGQLLTKIIEAMGFVRSEVYIANIVKCRPPNNRDPEPDEISECMPFLKQQIAAVQPKVIVALGRPSAQTLLATTTSITQLRGVWRDYQGVPLMPTFHPSYLLHSPEQKRFVWDDMKEVLAKLGRPVPKATR